MTHKNDFHIIPGGLPYFRQPPFFVSLLYARASLDAPFHFVHDRTLHEATISLDYSLQYAAVHCIAFPLHPIQKWLCRCLRRCTRDETDVAPPPTPYTQRASRYAHAFSARFFIERYPSYAALFPFSFERPIPTTFLLHVAFFSRAQNCLFLFFKKCPFWFILHNFDVR